MMSASLTGIHIEQRSCFNLILQLQRNGDVYDLSGANVTGQIRRDFDNSLQAVFKSEILDLTSGIVKLSLDGDQTQNIDLSPCSWDLYVDKEEECPDKLLYGPVYLIKNNTY
jgi:hypothetical protein